MASSLREEALIQNSLDHKNILKLYNVYENNDFLFLVMELIEGGSLRDIIKEKYYSKDRFFTELECSIIIGNILEGLDYIHSKKVIHRDIKPGNHFFLLIDNIMFSNKNDFNSLKIADFGFAVYSEDDKEDRVCGTLIYKSPEQIMNPHYDHTVDCWATGFILYLLCSGGKHPIYKSGMTAEEYTTAFKYNTDWDFPDEFPK